MTYTKDDVRAVLRQQNEVFKALQRAREALASFPEVNIDTARFNEAAVSVSSAVRLLEEADQSLGDEANRIQGYLDNENGD